MQHPNLMLAQSVHHYISRQNLTQFSKNKEQVKYQFITRQSEQITRYFRAIQRYLTGKQRRTTKR